MADRPTSPRLDVLIDRACRHLTEQEQRALRAGWADLTEAVEAQAAVAAAAEKAVAVLRDGAADREAILTEARDALEDAGAGGHGNDWPHLAPGIRALRARAERAEQQAAEAEKRISEYRDSRTRWMKAANDDRHCAVAAHNQLDAVRAECDAIEREQYGQHDEDADGMREAARRIHTALNTAGQDDTEEAGR